MDDDGGCGTMCVHPSTIKYTSKCLKWQLFVCYIFYTLKNIIVHKASYFPIFSNFNISVHQGTQRLMGPREYSWADWN
jgi:hypothetical protein